MLRYASLQVGLCSKANVMIHVHGMAWKLQAMLAWVLKGAMLEHCTEDGRLSGSMCTVQNPFDHLQIAYTLLLSLASWRPARPIPVKLILAV